MRVLEARCQPFPGFFLYYPSRPQQPAVLPALIDTSPLEQNRRKCSSDIARSDTIRDDNRYRVLVKCRSAEGSGRARFEGGFCDRLFLTARKCLILNGEMSEWLSAFAAKPLRRDIAP